MARGTIEDPWDEDSVQAGKDEWELLKDVFRHEGFDNYANGEWTKTFANGRWVQVTHDGYQLQFNFFDESMCYVSPEFVIDFFLNKRDLYL